MTDSWETIELYRSLMSRVERFARTLIAPRPGQSIWQLELDLVEYQREMRRAISDEERHRNALKVETVKAAHDRSMGWRENVSELQNDLRSTEVRMRVYEHALLASSRVGDALAWLLFDCNRRRLGALIENQQANNVPSGHALGGMLAAAETLGGAGAGFSSSTTSPTAYG